MENSGFIRNYRNLTAQPTAVVGGVGSVFGWKPKKEYRQVYGFDQDKVNYGDERDEKYMEWRPMTAVNNDTGEEFKFEVGYDSDGKISGVRHDVPYGKWGKYYGRDRVRDFFRNTFDRDATDYTIYRDSDDGYDYIQFDSKKEGPFVPSYALGKDKTLEVHPHVVEGESEYGNKPPVVADPNAPTIDTDGSEYDPAFNGTLFPTRMLGGAPSINNWGKLYSNVNGFLKDLHDIAFTEDKAKRRLMIDAALSNWGGAEVFSGILGNMKYLESLEDKGQYEGTYDPEKDYAYAKDYIWGLVKEWENQTFNNA